MGKKKKLKKRGPTTKRPPNALLSFQVGHGLVNVAKWSQELQDMTDVLLGRVDPPIDAGLMTLLEVADGYFARASEMTMQIHRLERQGQVKRGDPAYQFRTGELADFLAMAKRRGDKGSRDITYNGQIIEAVKTGRANHNDEFED